MLIQEVLMTCAFVLIYYITFIASENMVGQGTWMVISVAKCPGDSMFKYKFDVSRRKMNRTHDGFTVNLNFPGTLDETFAIRIDVCKDAEGGCKPYQVLADECLIKFINNIAENNVITALKLAGIDPPEFPIAAGEYNIVDYVFDYSELPTDGPYGIFGAQAYLIKDQMEVGCVEAMLEFKEADEDAADDEDDE